MRRDRALAAAVVLGLVAAICFVMCGAEDASADGDETTRSGSAKTPHSGLEATAPLPATSRGEEPGEEPGLVVRAPGGVDAGLADGGSLDEFIDAVGKQSVLQFLADNAATAEKHVDRYCAETKDLVSRKELVAPPRERDAAVYMAGRTDWEGGRIGLLHLPDSIVQRMGNPPGAWRQAGPDLYAGLDFGWMTELLQFDHWSLLGAGPLRDKAEVNFFEEILPNYMPLMSWSKLRLLKGVHEGNLAQASVEVRHLAELIGSTGSLVGEMVRVSIYNLERLVWEDVGRPVPEGLPSRDDGGRLRNSAFAGLYLLYPGVPRAVKEKALKCIPMRCAALIEGIGVTASLRHLVPGAQEELDWLLTQTPCDSALAARAARSPPITREVLGMNFNGDASLLRSLQSLTDGGL